MGLKSLLKDVKRKKMSPFCTLSLTLCLKSLSYCKKNVYLCTAKLNY